MLIVGLGNVGSEYKNTYHNMGFVVLDKLAKQLNTKFNNTECKAKTAVVYIDGKKLVLAKPTTFMNLSGESVRELLGKYRMTHDDLVVVYDDVDIPIGALRLREDGSGGSHNGMKNIIGLIGDGRFKRVRVGTGFDRGDVPLISVVLSKVKGENKKLTDASTDRAADALYEYAKSGDFGRIMQKYNG